MQWRLGCAFLSAAFLLTGCLNAEVRDQISGQKQEIVQGIRTAEKPSEEIKHDPLLISDDIFTGNRSVRMLHGVPLPPHFEASHAFTISSSTPLSLAQIGTMVAAQTGISVRLSDGADRLGGSGPGAGAAATAPPSPFAALAQTERAAPSAPATDSTAMPVAFDGSLANFLDLVSAHFGVTWRYDGASIVFSRYETRTFVIESLPGEQKLEDGSTESDQGGTSGGSSSSSSSSGSSGASPTNSASSTLTQTADMNATINYWDDLNKAITAILGGVGTAQIAPSSGTVTVITTPDIMRRIAEYISAENKRLSQQVAIDIELFTLDINDDEQYGLNMDTVFQNLAGWPNLTLSVPSAASGTGSLTVAVASSTSKFDGSTNVIQALSTMGRVSRIAKLPVTTLNNRPAVRRIGNDVAYLQSVQTSNVTSVGTETALTPGIIHEGFSVQTTPRILSDGRILLQYSLSVVDLNSIATFTSNGSEIELPDTTSRVFIQQAILRSGNTLILAGFSDNQLNSANQGVGNPFNLLLGGSVTASRSHSLLFIMITPRELKMPAPSVEEAG